ncbi:hypothetical protein PG996_006077 [Apiospora saccharicola]|uniref:Uncharacterized protein n=1 Tax=Apiospora saccharicola TaxID=335842 RepID=A0ABR1VN98_9PEZI
MASRKVDKGKRPEEPAQASSSRPGASQLTDFLLVQGRRPREPPAQASSSRPGLSELSELTLIITPPRYLSGSTSAASSEPQGTELAPVSEEDERRENLVWTKDPDKRAQRKRNLLLEQRLLEDYGQAQAYIGKYISSDGKRRMVVGTIGESFYTFLNWDMQFVVNIVSGYRDSYGLLAGVGAIQRFRAQSLLGLLLRRVGRVRFAWGLETRESPKYPTSFVIGGPVPTMPQLPHLPAVMGGGRPPTAMSSATKKITFSAASSKLTEKLKGKLRRARSALILTSSSSPLSEKQKGKQRATEHASTSSTDDSYLASADENFRALDLGSDNGSGSEASGSNSWVAPALPEIRPTDGAAVAELNFVSETIEELYDSIKDSKSLRRRVKEFVAALLEKDKA